MASNPKIKPGNPTYNGLDFSQIILDEPTKRDMMSETQAELDRQLPAKQSTKGQINWLGSSYTGQDIKVVAHLYDNSSDTNQVANLQEQKDLLNEKLEALMTLDFNANTTVAVLNIPNYSPAVKSFLTAIILEARANIDPVTVFGLIKLREKKALEENISAVEQDLWDIEKVKAESASTLTLGTLQTLSVSSFRDRVAIRSLGTSYVKGYTNGPRTLAGSMIFTVFEEHPLKKLILAIGKQYDTFEAMHTLLPDQLPPIDLTIVFANEYGSLSRQTLYGVQFVSDGTTYSIENLLSEQVLQFVCRDIDVLTAEGLIPLTKLGRPNYVAETTGSQLLTGNTDYQNYLIRLGLRNRLKNR